MLLKADVESIECIVCQDHLLLFGVLSWSGQEGEWWKPCRSATWGWPFCVSDISNWPIATENEKKPQTVALTPKYVIHYFMLS